MDNQTEGHYLALEATMVFVLASLGMDGGEMEAMQERLTNHIVSGMQNARAIRPDRTLQLAEVNHSACAAVNRMFDAAKSIV